ncbi:MAG: manganese efflux pump MntP family protein [Oscillospiraceae bacterium]|nr:manganese efflux pump MntP family protein [Oscillospiraceae bacterium]
MKLLELLILSVGLSMDAFAMAVCKGFALRKASMKSAVIVGLYFGVSQALMPTIGYLLASAFADVIKAVDHWIAVVLLSIIGIHMIYEGIRNCEDASNSSLAFMVMLPLAIASSIDAMAAGVSIVMLEFWIVPVALTIGATTFAFSAAGVYLGARFGSRLGSKAEIIGGVILVGLGCKILLEHLLL